MTIDLPIRTEKRFIIRDYNKFIGLIEQFMERRRFSENEYTQTIYFNNEEHAVPFYNTLRCRKYASSPASLVKFPSDEDIYFVDMKGGYYSVKERIKDKSTMGHAREVFNGMFSFPTPPLRPYIFLECFREHYTPRDKGDESVRITIDKNLRYFFFPEEGEDAVKIGEMEYPRVEIKFDSSEAEIVKYLNGALRDVETIPVVSNKFTAYKFLGPYIAGTESKQFNNEFGGVEIEAKMTSENEEIFPKIKDFILNENIPGFRIPSHFPYTFEAASINKYFQHEGKTIKDLSTGRERAIIKKGDMEICKNRFDIDCIVKREESKEKISLNSEIMGGSELKGSLYRMRKVFWVENTNTERFYAVSFDCCLDLGDTKKERKLHQLEIEYQGKYSGSKSEDENIEECLVDDTAFITKSLLDNFSQEIKPTKLTKEEWLSGFS